MEINTGIKFFEIQERCRSDFQEYMPTKPEEDTEEEWQEYIDALEELRDELSDIAWNSVDSWDWAIYTHWGWKILLSVPQEYEDRGAESFFELCGNDTVDMYSSPWELMHKMSYFVLLEIYQDVAQEVINEEIEKAESEIYSILTGCV